MGEDLADELIDATIRNCPAWRPGTRPIHAPGVAATGWFVPTLVASSMTTAAPFAGPRVPVTVRFSNGTCDIAEPDSWPAVRGMAVKFHLGDLSRDEWGVSRSEVEVDLISITLPVFWVRTVEQFRQFVSMTAPALPRPIPRWHMLLEMLRLDVPTPAPPLGVPSSNQGVFAFVEQHHESFTAFAKIASAVVPSSYTACSYHAIHAFVLTGPDAQKRSVRFHWEPVGGVEVAPIGAAGNFLRGGLYNEIAESTPEFVLRIEIAEQGDDVADPTRPWPTRRRRVAMGTLRLTNVPDDQFHGGELLSFDPGRLVPGIEVSADPILAARCAVYRRSYERRVAVATQLDLPDGGPGGQ